MDRDKYDEQAERLGPCPPHCASLANQPLTNNQHSMVCAWKFRPAVAAALRESGKREAELLSELNRISEELGLPPGIGPAHGWLKEQLANYKMAAAERDDLRQEVERLNRILEPAPHSLGEAYRLEAERLRREVERLTHELVEAGEAIERERQRADWANCMYDSRERYLSEVNAQMERLKNSAVELAEIAHRQNAKIAALKAKLGELRNFADKYPCHCAQHYPGTSEYHGHDCETAVAQEFVAQWLSRAEMEKKP